MASVKRVVEISSFASKYLKKYSFIVILIIIFSFISSFFEVFGVGALIPFFQQVFEGNQKDFFLFKYLNYFNQFFFGGKEEFLILLLIFFVFLMIVLKNLFFYLNSLLSARVSERIRKHLQVNLFNKLLSSDISFFDKEKTGHFVAAISTYSQNISTFIFNFLQLFIANIKVFVFFGFLIFLSWKAALFSIILIIFLFFIAKFLLRIMRKNSRILEKNVSELHHKLNELLNNILIIKLFCTEDYEKVNFKKIAKNIENAHYTEKKYSLIITPVSEILVSVSLVIVFLLMLFLKYDFKTELPVLGVFLFFFYRTFTQLDQMITLLGRLTYHLEQFKEYERILKKTLKFQSKEGNLTLKLLKKGISFQNVSFSYSGNKKILDKVSFFIPKNKFTAIVGAVGSGKTTIVKLIAGIYLPTKGKIFIDKITTKNLNKAEWRKKIGFVNQDTVIFNNTIKYNISYGNFNATEDEIISAAKKVGIHDYVKTLPEGYNTLLGEKGLRLSGGQRQLVSIARTLLKNPEIIIMDEATSNLDSETEKKVHKIITEISKKKTIIAIAHRLTTIMNADNIIVLDNGKVKEQGKHNQLIKKPKSLYKKLWETQFKKNEV